MSDSGVFAPIRPHVIKCGGEAVEFAAASGDSSLLVCAGDNRFTVWSTAVAAPVPPIKLLETVDVGGSATISTAAIQPGALTARTVCGVEGGWRGGSHADVARIAGSTSQSPPPLSPIIPGRRVGGIGLHVWANHDVPSSTA